MLTLKDIKISKTRIPLQNAIWLRPIGGLKFKIYYPHGGSWAELGVTSSSDDGGITPSPTPTPTPTPNYTVSKASWEPMKVIVCKCIPMKARIGAKYYFADGRIKFKTKSSNGAARIHTYGFKEQTEIEFSSYPIVPLWRKENFNPLLVTIISKEEYDKNRNDTTGLPKTVDKFSTIYGNEIVTVYYYTTHPEHLNCDTTSPYFKVIDGHIRNVSPVRMPKFYRADSVLNEAKHFSARLLKYRGRKARTTKMWNFNYTAPEPIPIQMKRQWKKLSTWRLQGILTIASNRTHWKNNFKKTLLIQQIIKNRKSIEKAVIRRHSKASRGSRGMFFAEFRRVVMIK